MHIINPPTHTLRESALVRAYDRKRRCGSAEVEFGLEVEARAMNRLNVPKWPMAYQI